MTDMHKNARTTFFFILACIASLPLAPHPVRAETSKFAVDAEALWPIYRGDQALTGVAKGELPRKMKLLWSFKTGDAVKSSPVVGGGKVFVGSYDGKVYALDMYTGKKVWDFDTGAAVEASPLLVDGTLFAGSLNGVLFALDAGKGKQRWKYETGDRVAGSANWVKTGSAKRTWIVVGSYDSSLHCVDAQNGRKVWTYKTDNFINGTPAVYKKSTEIVVFGGCDGKLRLVSAVSGKQISEINAGSYIPASIAIFDDHAFFGHYGNRLLCVDLSRMRIRWEYGDGEQGAAFFSSPAVLETKVLIGSKDGALHCVDRETGKQLWVFKTGGEIDSSPVVCGDKAVFGSLDGRLYMVDTGSGTAVWSYEIGGGITSTPAVAGGMVVIGSDDGRVYAFGSPKK